jgi:hypothetical protein
MLRNRPDTSHNSSTNIRNLAVARNVLPQALAFARAAGRVDRGGIVTVIAGKLV